MRYALYYAPEQDSRLWEKLCCWFGRDPETNQAIVRPAVKGISTDRLIELTKTPARYGPHATLKAPFRLHTDMHISLLTQRLEEFCAGYCSFPLPRLTIACIDNFFCLVPGEYSIILQNLAATCVQEFDRFRASLTPLEKARRRAAILTDKEKHYLQAWGYPYVLDCYRFHITLTARIHNQAERNRVLWAITHEFDDILQQEPVWINGISLFVEPEPGMPFQLKQRFPCEAARTENTQAAIEMKNEISLNS